MGMRKVAVVGAGMTKFVRRAQETAKERTWEAAHMALESCELTMDDIDGVCFGTAPDAFDGVHYNGEYVSDGAGAWRKPYMRSYVGGGTGVFVPIQGWYHIASGLFDVVMVVAEEKMSSYYPHAQAAFMTIFDHTTERPLKPNLLWIFAMEDRKSTRLNSSHGYISYAVFCLKKNKNGVDARALLMHIRVFSDDTSV